MFVPLILILPIISSLLGFNLSSLIVPSLTTTLSVIVLSSIFFFTLITFLLFLLFLLLLVNNNALKPNNIINIIGIYIFFFI